MTAAPSRATAVPGRATVEPNEAAAVLSGATAVTSREVTSFEAEDVHKDAKNEGETGTPDALRSAETDPVATGSAGKEGGEASEVKMKKKSTVRCNFLCVKQKKNARSLSFTKNINRETWCVVREVWGVRREPPLYRCAR